MGQISKSLDGVKAKRRHWVSLVLFDQSGQQVHPKTASKPFAKTLLTTLTQEVSSNGKIYGLMTLRFDPKPGIQKQINNAKILNIIVLAILILTFFAMNIFLDRLIRRPMIKLADFADRIAKGSYQTSLSITSGDEVGSLGRSLETMRQKIFQREVTMNHYAEIQNTIRFIQSKFISEQGSSHVFLELQCRILKLTKCEAGFIGEMNQNDNKSLLLKALSLTNFSNIHASNQVGIEALPDSNYMPELESLLGSVDVSPKP